MRSCEIQSLRLMAGFAITILNIPQPHASIIKQYSLILLQVNGKPYCRGILIGKTAFTAAHCLKNGKGNSIIYIKEGRHLTAKPKEIINLANDQNNAQRRDIGVLLFESSIDGDVDGSIDVSPRTTDVKNLNKQSYYFSDKWLFQPKDKNFGLISHRDYYLYFRGSARSQFMFAINSSRGAFGYFSDLNTAKQMNENLPGLQIQSAESSLICHGHSGAPVFSEAYGISHLAGIATAIDNSVLDKAKKECSDLFLADKFDGIADKYLLQNYD